MILLPFGIVFAGYTITYYGVCLLKGPGMGLFDLLVPSRAAKADETIGSWSGLAQPPGLQPGP
jgi:hypothetical protein